MDPDISREQLPSRDSEADESDTDMDMDLEVDMDISPTVPKIAAKSLLVATCAFRKALLLPLFPVPGVSAA